MRELVALLELLRMTRLPLGDEKAAQRELARVLSGVGIAARREVRLGPGEIADFLIESGPLAGTLLEVKLSSGGSKREIYRQLLRYAGHSQVETLVLVTNKAMGLPGQIGGKPACYVSLGRAWL